MERDRVTILDEGMSQSRLVMEAKPYSDGTGRFVRFVRWFHDEQSEWISTHNDVTGEQWIDVEQGDVSGTNPGKPDKGGIATESTPDPLGQGAFSIQAEESEVERSGESTQARPSASVDPVERDRIMRSFSVDISLYFIRFLVHTKLGSVKQLLAWLESRYDPGSYSVQIRTNMYHVEVRRHDNHSRRTWSDQQWIDELVTWLVTLEAEHVGA